MPERKSNLEPIGVLIEERIKNNDVSILGLILLQFGNLFTDEELAKSISTNGKYCYENVLNVIKKSRELAYKSMSTT